MVELESAIKSLSENEVKFVIDGGVEFSAHSTGYITRDLDFCYSREKENLTRIVKALASYKPRLRPFPDNLPFAWDVRTLLSGTNFTLETDIGEIDLLGEVSGVGDYEAVKKESELMCFYGCDVYVLSIEGLIKAKKASGRTKDLLVLPELEALQEMLNKTSE